MLRTTLKIIYEMEVVMEQSCSRCSCGSGSCGSGSCSCPCHHQVCSVCHSKMSEDGSCEDFPKSMLELADAAWMEVLKEEIKAHIMATQKGRMKELAKIISEANNQRWKNKMEKKHGCNEFKEKLCSFFSKK